MNAPESDAAAESLKSSEGLAPANKGNANRRRLADLRTLACVRSALEAAAGKPATTGKAGCEHSPTCNGDGRHATAGKAGCEHAPATNGDDRHAQAGGIREKRGHVPTAPIRAAFVVGLSGGADSSCLAHAMARLAKPLGFSMTCVHVNHMLRGEQAARDELASAALAKSIGSPFSVARADVKAEARAARISLEEAGREARYRAFEAKRVAIAASSGLPTYIAVAHNRDDLAETALLNALRGSGLDGIASMARAAPASRAIRPLLGVSREDILIYCALHGISPVHDSSNEDSAFMRNRLRNEIMPLIRERVNPDAASALARLAASAAEDTECLWELARAAYREARCELPLPGAPHGSTCLRLDALAGSPTAIASRVAMIALAQAASERPPAGLCTAAAAQTDGSIAAAPAGDPTAAAAAPAGPLPHPAAALPQAVLRNLRREHVTAVLELFSRPSVGKSACMPSGLRAIGVYGGVAFHRVGISQRHATDIGAVPVPSQARPVTHEPSPPHDSRKSLLPLASSGQRLCRSFHIKTDQVVEQVKNIRYNSCVQYFDAEAAMSGPSAGELVIRHRMPGDRFHPIRSPGSKSLKDYYIDEKIPAGERGSIFLLADGSEIIWVVGRRISDRYKVCESTRVVLRVELAACAGG